MKALRYIGMAFVAVVLSASFCACSDDDDNEGNVSSSSLSGTTWKVTSCNDYEGDPLFENGTLLTFNKDKTVTLNPNLVWGEEYNYPGEYIYWSLNNDVLTIDFRHDDCIEGPFVITGNTATFTYFWYDYNWHWSRDEYYTITLEKQ